MLEAGAQMTLLNLLPIIGLASWEWLIFVQ